MNIISERRVTLRICNIFIVFIEFQLHFIRKIGWCALQLNTSQLITINISTGLTLETCDLYFSY